MAKISTKFYCMASGCKAIATMVCDSCEDTLCTKHVKNFTKEDIKVLVGLGHDRAFIKDLCEICFNEIKYELSDDKFDNAIEYLEVIFDSPKTSVKADAYVKLTTILKGVL